MPIRICWCVQERATRRWRGANEYRQYYALSFFYTLREPYMCITTDFRADQKWTRKEKHKHLRRPTRLISICTHSPVGILREAHSHTNVARSRIHASRILINSILQSCCFDFFYVLLFSTKAQRLTHTHTQREWRQAPTKKWIWKKPEMKNNMQPKTAAANEIRSCRMRKKLNRNAELSTTTTATTIVEKMSLNFIYILKTICCCHCCECVATNANGLLN